MDGGVSVHFAGGGLENLALGAPGQSKHVVSTKDTGLGGLDGVVLIMDRGGRTSEVVDFIHLGPIGLTDVVAYDFEIGLPQKMPHILFAAGVKIVQANHLIVFIDQALAQMRADKTGATGY